MDGLVRRVWQSIQEPSSDELREMAKAAAETQRHAAPGKPIGGVARRRLRNRSTLTFAAAAALLIGSGLGFGIGRSLTPSGSARSEVVGFGFLPVRGWTVVQEGKPDAVGSGTAIAANVPLAGASGGLGATIEATLAALPDRGIVIVTEFTPRGDPGEDFKFPVGSPDLRIAEARPQDATSTGVPNRPDMHTYRLRAGVAGFNVDVRMYFVAAPSAAQLTAAQRQLNRLVVASDRVTIAARPMIVQGSQSITLFGSVANSKAGETVEVQVKDCGQDFFRVVDGATTIDGGGWSSEYWPGITTSLRAAWDGSSSAQIVVRQRIFVRLDPVPSKPAWLRVGVAGKISLWRKQVLFQQFDRRLGVWKTVRPIVLTEQESAGPSGVWATASFRAGVPKGTMVRALFPAKAARPCYLSGTSRVLKA